MPGERREDVVRSVVTAYVRTRTPKEISDFFELGSVSREIVRRLDEQFTVWRKWSAPREAVAKSAVGCWIPLEDLRAFLNEMPGPELTPTDMAQRLRAFCEEDCEPPNESFREGCLAIYEPEKAQGTELAAIIGRLREHIEHEEVRLYRGEYEQQRQQVEERRRALELSFLAGEDCKRTPVGGSQEVYCRVNGRAYRLAPKDGATRNLFRISSIEDQSPRLIGKYANQTAATKALTQIAYQPEPR